MIQKKAGVFLGSLFLVVLLLGVVGAQEGCWIENRADCLEADTPSEYIIMGLSGPTNAHGEVVQFVGTTNKYACLGEGCSSWDDDQTGCEAQAGCSYGVNYDYVLCCNFGNKLQKNECSGGYTILQLSSSTNAHAEVLGGTAYTNQDNHVCSQHLGGDCRTSPATDYNIILSLSGLTNAHIGPPNVYDTKIYCKTDYIGTYCGDGVCGGDGTCLTPNDLGQIEQCDDGNLVNDDACSNYCLLTGAILEPEAYWANEDFLQIYEGSQIDVHIGSTTILSVLKNYGLTPGETISFEIYENDPWPLPDDDIRVGAEAINGVADGSGNVFAEWKVSYSDIEKTNDHDDFYFKAIDQYDEVLVSKSYNIGFGEILTIPCITISLCMNYGQDSCASDVCDVSTLSVELNSDIKCDDEGITCECWWNETAGTCNSRWGASGVGSCKNGEGITEECTAENLFLRYSWTATWTWDEGADQQDPDNLALAAKCVGGSNAVPCPAQIQLPFINTYNIIAIIVAIVLIYFLMNLKKKKRKRKVSKKKK